MLAANSAYFGGRFADGFRLRPLNATIGNHDDRLARFGSKENGLSGQR